MIQENDDVKYTQEAKQSPTKQKTPPAPSLNEQINPTQP
jgi:hypothetical protein